MELLNPFSVPDPAMYAIPVFILFLLGELWILTKIRHQQYDYPEALASISMGIGVVVVNLFSKTIFLSLFVFLYQFRLLESLGPVSFEQFYDLNWHKEYWWTWAILFFADDFTFYWFHRLAHEVRILWAGHVNHHSSQDYNYATALRQGWWEDVYKYAFWLWLPLIGFHPIAIFFMMQVNLTFQFFVHTETVGKLGWLEWIFNTPSHHRVHHASDIHYLDKNYAGILIIWDRIFGTFEPETEKPHYGLTENINTKNPFHIATHELIAIAKDVSSAEKWGDKLRYLFLGPGWRHDGEDKRAKILQQKRISSK